MKKTILGITLIGLVALSVAASYLDPLGSFVKLRANNASVETVTTTSLLVADDISATTMSATTVWPSGQTVTDMVFGSLSYVNETSKTVTIVFDAGDAISLAIDTALSVGPTSAAVVDYGTHVDFVLSGASTGTLYYTITRN